jgi:hypothetical protein
LAVSVLLPLPQRASSSPAVSSPTASHLSQHGIRWKYHRTKHGIDRKYQFANQETLPATEFAKLSNRGNSPSYKSFLPGNPISTRVALTADLASPQGRPHPNITSGSAALRAPGANLPTPSDSGQARHAEVAHRSVEAQGGSLRARSAPKGHSLRGSATPP